MQALAQENLVTLEEYLAAEEVSLVRHEYWAGYVYAMAGGTPSHADIIFNLSRAFGNALDNHKCRGSSGDQRIRIEETNVSLYPDLVVKCPPEKYSERDPDALVNPALLAEVLSPHSERDDRGEKFTQYALIPELKDYLLISQNKIQVEHYQRQETGKKGQWVLQRHNSRDDVIVLLNLGIEIPLAQIYKGLELPSGLTVLGRNLP